MAREFTLEQITEKIQILLRQTTDRGATEAEAASAAAAVQRLLTKYNLDLQEIGSGENEKKGSPQVVHEEVYMGAGNTGTYFWCLNLANAVAEACYCRYLYYRHTRRVVFVGRLADTVVARELYGFLVQQIKQYYYQELWGVPEIKPKEPTKIIKINKDNMVLVPKYWSMDQAVRRPMGQGHKFRQSFFLGAVQKLSERLKASRQEDTKEYGQGVVALVACRDAENDSYIQKTWGRLRSKTNKSNVRLSPEAYHLGQKAGGKMDITAKRSLTEG